LRVVIGPRPRPEIIPFGIDGDEERPPAGGFSPSAVKWTAPPPLERGFGCGVIANAYP